MGEKCYWCGGCLPYHTGPCLFGVLIQKGGGGGGEKVLLVGRLPALPHRPLSVWCTNTEGGGGGRESVIGAEVACLTTQALVCLVY